ncbi:histidine phosphatase family protein [Paenibacillus thermoaerophilus]|uniref:Histidine phosphatase family protein n=1 Tax=Paenibacillus thermoaerophilus TaxID=1215385 RepID=A0ABW2V6I2_9BACL|nr:histidine phosphatase family protein [Paenibacillus thermoaerophilus]TMV18692.1 histidine phosphatase family protein [Paenibacillus thermoaerophilus]
MKLGWIRHGETDWNALGRIQGQTDIPLNAKGKDQALAIASRFRREDWDWIATSDLRRALETARTVEAVAGIPVRSIDPRLREKSFGDAEGMTFEERSQLGDAQIGGAESDDEVVSRAMDWIEETDRLYPGARVLAVTHGGLLARVLPRLIPDLTAGPIGNTSLTVVEKRNGQWHCLLYNCTDHLNMETRRSG